MKVLRRLPIITMFLLMLVISIATILALSYVTTPPPPKSPRYWYRPLVGGLQIAIPINATHEALCSIGFTAYKYIYGDEYVYVGFVTADHCFNYSYSDDVYQNTSIYVENFVGSACFIRGIDVGIDAAFVCVATIYCPSGDTTAVLHLGLQTEYCQDFGATIQLWI